MRPLYIFLFALSCQAAVAQTKKKVITSANRYSSVSSLYDEGTLFAKVNTLSFLDPNTPTLQLGVEYRFNKRFAIEITPGIPVYTYKEIRPTDSTYNRYYKIKAGLKFYPGRRPRFYVGPEFFFTHRARSKFDGVVDGKDGVDSEYRYAELEKNIIGATLKIGLVAPISERINLEQALAFGPRFVYLNLNATNLDRTNYVRSMFNLNTDRIGSSLGMHIAMEFKISYTIK